MQQHRHMEDFVTWVDTSKLKRTVMKYNDEVCSQVFLNSIPFHSKISPARRFRLALMFYTSIRWHSSCTSRHRATLPPPYAPLAALSCHGHIRRPRKIQPARARSSRLSEWSLHAIIDRAHVVHQRPGPPQIHMVHSRPRATSTWEDIVVCND